MPVGPLLVSQSNSGPDSIELEKNASQGCTVFKRAAEILGTLVVVAANITASQAPSPLAFDAISIKPENPNDQGGSAIFRGGRYIAVNITAHNMIASAFENPDGPLLNQQIVGGPDWVRAERFNIQATLPSNVTLNSSDVARIERELLRRLLEDRFALRTHIETRQLPAYALVMARNGRLGPKLSRSTSDCSVAPGRPREPRCQIRLGTGAWFGTLTIETLVRQLSGPAERIVINQTGLTGTFDVDLHWSPDGAAATDPDTTAFVTALQEQLGLKLQATRAPGQVVVIDRIERPTPN